MDVEYSIDRKAYETDCQTDNLIEITEKLKEMMQRADDETSWKDLKEEMLSLIIDSEENVKGLRKSVDGLFSAYGYYSRFTKKLYSFGNLGDFDDARRKIEDKPIEGNEKLYNEFIAQLEKEMSCHYTAAEIKSKLDYYMKDEKSDYSIIYGMGRYVNH